MKYIEFRQQNINQSETGMGDKKWFVELYEDLTLENMDKKGQKAALVSPVLSSYQTTE